MSFFSRLLLMTIAISGGVSNRKINIDEMSKIYINSLGLVSYIKSLIFSNNVKSVPTILAYARWRYKNDISCYKNLIKTVLYYSCEAGSEFLFDYIIKKYKIKNIAPIIFKYAYKGGNLNIINKLHNTATTGPNTSANTPEEIAYMFEGSCEGSRVTLVKKLINKVQGSKFIFNACVGGNREIINLICKLGPVDWDLGLQGACKGSQTKLIKYILRKHSTTKFNRALAVEYACEAGSIAAIKLINWELSQECFYKACKSGNLELVKLMMELGPFNNWNIGLVGACYSGCRPVVDLMLSKIENDCYNRVYIDAYENAKHLGNLDTREILNKLIMDQGQDF